MKDKNGFTLIEVIATISILVIIASIALPSIISMRTKNIDKNEQNILKIAENAAESYIYTYNFDIDDVANNNKCIQIKELLNKQFVTSNEQLEKIKNKYIVISKDENNIIYEIKDNCISNQILVYVESSNPEGSLPEESSQEYTDGSGANAPILADGMIPVYYDGINWKKADTAQKWYDYNEQWWANAVTVNDASLRTSNPGTTIPMDKINSMWVWIPRYKYRITFNTVGVENSSAFFTIYNKIPGKIDIIFESGTDATGASYKDNATKIDTVTKRNMSTLAISEYYTHPAFRNGNEVYNTSQYDQGGWNKELEGIWVGKFETSGTSDLPTIIPNATPLKSQTVSTQSTTAQKFTTTSSTYGITNQISHMMKNTEWGAVAYLYQSKYGKVGNPNYASTKREVEIYPNMSTQTGCSSQGDSKNSYSASQIAYNNGYGPETMDYTCNKYNTEIGFYASTTGNIYGIYDMNGGVSERMMSGTSITKSNLQEKYSTVNISSARILGDATYETKRWYNAKYITNLESSMYFLRGGNTSSSWGIDNTDSYKGVISAGIFSFELSNTSSSSTIGFRTVIAQ